MKFVADDGKIFDTAEECKAHEATLVSLVGLTQADLDEAFANPAGPLAALIERTGRELAKKRLEAGVRKRAPNGSRSDKFAPPSAAELAQQVKDFDDVMGAAP